jgi:sulfite exporter TauE/SafE
MDAALVASAALMGLAGAPHCAAMCGAAYGAFGGGTAGRAALLDPAVLALQFGRAAGYAAAGAVVAVGVGSLGTLGLAAPVLRPLWAMVHVAAIVLGLWLLVLGRVPAWLSAAPRATSLLEARPVRLVRRLPRSARAGLVGACWVGVPCGLLQSALLVAALASSPVQGASVMAAFALASAPGLWLGPALWRRLAHGRGERAAAAGSVRLAGALVAGASTFALWHGLEGVIAAICRT